MLKTDRCSIYEIKESDLADVRILFTDDEVRTYLGGAYDKARASSQKRKPRTFAHADCWTLWASKCGSL